MWSPTAGFMPPPRARTRRPGPRSVSAGGELDRADRLDLAVLVDDHAAVLGEELAGALGAGQQRRLRERLRLERGRRRAPWRRRGRSRPARRSRGSSRWWAKRPSARRQTRTLSPEVATAPALDVKRVRSCSPVRGCSTRTSNRRSGVARRRPAGRRRSRPRSAAWPASRSASRSAARPLPIPPLSKRTPVGRRIDAERLVDLDHRPAPRRARRGRAARAGANSERLAQRRRRRRPRGTPHSRRPRSRRPGSDRRGRRCDAAAADAGRDGVAKQRRRRDHVARVGVQRAELAVGAKPRKALLELLDERPRLGDRPLGIGAAGPGLRRSGGRREPIARKLTSALLMRSRSPVRRARAPGRVRRGRGRRGAGAGAVDAAAPSDPGAGAPATGVRR